MKTVEVTLVVKMKVPQSLAHSSTIARLLENTTRDDGCEIYARNLGTDHMIAEDLSSLGEDKVRAVKAVLGVLT
jgi:hypothetical protein